MLKPVSVKLLPVLRKLNLIFKFCNLKFFIRLRVGTKGQHAFLKLISIYKMILAFTIVQFKMFRHILTMSVNSRNHSISFLLINTLNLVL